MALGIALRRDPGDERWTLTIFVPLQDGVINGAVYALVAIALVLVFAVTRVIFVLQGRVRRFAALTVAAISVNGIAPSTPWFCWRSGFLVAISDVVWHFRDLTWKTRSPHRRAGSRLPIALLLLTQALALMKLSASLSTSRWRSR